MNGAGGHANHVTARMPFHFGDGELRDVKEAGEIHVHDRSVVFGGMLGAIGRTPCAATSGHP